jgi:hypothetical protein
VFNLPELTDHASKHFTYADICQCSETWRRTLLDNAPRELETYRAISKLCETILEPVVEEFGRIELTYGFAGVALTRKISHRIAPKLDQHAGYERRPSGEYVCSRLGQAVDFRVREVSSRDVARFIIERLPFDRLYIYGSERPLHVSVGPQQAGAIFEMRQSGGRLTPRALQPNDFTVRD